MRTSTTDRGLNRWRDRLGRLRRKKPSVAGVSPPQQIPLTDFIGSASSIELYAAGGYGYRPVDQDEDEEQIIRPGRNDEEEQSGREGEKTGK